MRVSGVLVDPPPSDVGDAEIKVTLPAGLRAGLNPVQVVHQIPLGDPPVVHDGVGFESNVAALVVAPLITTPAPISAAAGSAVTLDVSPPVGREQRVAVLIGPRAVAVAPRPPTDPEAASTVDVQLPADVGPGTELLRIRVDGALSPVQVDDNAASPKFNQFVAPTIEIT